LARWENHFSQLLNVNRVNDVRLREIHTAEPQMPELSASDFEIAVEKLKRHESSGIDQIAAEILCCKDRAF
jgi:hypothetical protein